MTKCKICKSIISGRSDKKYCSIQCKNEYHQKLRAVNQVATATIDKILHKNRRILLEVMGKKTMKRKVKRWVLDEKQFNYAHITGYYTNRQGKIYHYVYDFAWMLFSDQEVLIVRKSS